ncbi:energy-coupling factor transporter transmembrane component T family protein [Geodermatophilus sabuli]|uniref:Biotin transport system permease protein n=1 Tax=Geodermatophilus sabuli TaxID=1564158 RepID=A0A285E5U9_9ACTN|nr:energy-coupling factor transporter transmembrane protein EcfT [Geodermatophilus sabuli]MBB3082682.1 biotin transport system permease protein [Geodermatophilus sabuli]SNX94452.1 biotin transport system permease protein [Geodermatophilus sabuli]
MLSLYLPGASPVHRAPAGLKLAVLAALGVGLFLVSRVEVVAGALAAVLAVGLAVARLPGRALWAQVRPVWIWLAALFVVHLLVTGPLPGAVAVLRLLTLVLAAAVVTATTRVTALVAVVEWLVQPLRLVGVRPARVGLVVAMTLRFIPLLAERAARIREAQTARGAERVRLGLLVPLVISVLQLAHTLSEALDARGADDTPARPLRRAAGSVGPA